MSRNHGRVMASIWRDPDWRALSRGAQATYTMLLSQPDLGHCGIIGLSARRWSHYSAGLTEDEVLADLRELEGKGRFVVVDEDTEEVLVRSLIRNDGVWRMPNVMRAAADNVREVESAKLRAVLVEELRRVPLAELSDEPGRKGAPTTRAQVSEVVGCLVAALEEGLREGLPEPIGEPSMRARAHLSPSPTPSPTPSVLAGTQVALRGDLAPADAPAVLTETQRSKPITDAYAELVPLCNWPAINGVVRKAIRAARYADEEIDDAMVRLGREGRSVTVETLRIELEGRPPPNINGRQAETDAMFSRAMARAEARERNPG